ncbi:SDH family Clp fold serine proteinase [Thermodesulfatator atlanticus]|uniref:SDH family Clp fold serine proteinase n=1 Tax=Thermodesulfatator atlanticus TaxID=501497 RepID=UPI0003B554F2|nr:ATP-dependent Clp protease proteolytic subunit [Thermodesulfatator atlanticus]
MTGGVSGFDIFWLIFIIMMFQPMLRQKFLEAARQRMIRKLEQKRNSRVILLVHRQETMSLLGFPIMRFIDINDSEQVIRAIHMTDPDVPIDIILHTPGGVVLASLQIAKALKRHKAKTTAFVPHYAMSGGTLIALAADEIVMDEHAVLGPVDPQIGQFPAASLVKVRQTKPIDKIDDETLILADVAEKALNQMEYNLEELLNGRFPKEKVKELAKLLSQGRWTHDYPITFDEAKALGLPVSKNMPEEIYELMNLFPQPMRQQPSVEFAPAPRRIPPRGNNH